MLDQVWNTVVQKVILGKTLLDAITGRLYNFSADIQRSLQQLSSFQHKGIVLKIVCSVKFVLSVLIAINW